MTSSAERDGRTLRAERTRAAIIEALVALLREGDLEPDGPRIAERAGVSVRSLYVHFTNLEDLYLAATQHTTALVVSMLTPIDPTQPLLSRIDLLCGQRARINEEIGPLRHAATRRLASSPTLAEARAFGRTSSRNQLDRVFATELDRLDPDTRRRRLASFDAAISGETWDLLRTTHGLSPDEARVAMNETVRTLLAPG